MLSMQSLEPASACCLHRNYPREVSKYPVCGGIDRQKGEGTGKFTSLRGSKLNFDVVVKTNWCPQIIGNPTDVFFFSFAKQVRRMNSVDMR